MQYLLTGGYGCIGSWIVKNLVDDGHDVAIYDLVEHTARMALIMDEDQIARVRFIEGDIADGSHFTRVVEKRALPASFTWLGCRCPFAGPTPSRVPRST